jgi:hypothetical protein
MNEAIGGKLALISIRLRYEPKLSAEIRKKQYAILSKCAEEKVQPKLKY